MSIDLNLCRDILAAVAGRAEDGTDSATASSRAQPELEALFAAGLLKLGTDEAGAAMAESVTASGREFLRLAGNEVLWKRVGGELAATGRPVTLDMVRARLLEWAQFS